MPQFDSGAAEQIGRFSEGLLLRLLQLGESYHPLPWKVLTYDTRLEGYVIDLDRERLKNAPRYGVGEEPFADPAFGQLLGDYYGAR
jgi:hypothetical protein